MVPIFETKPPFVIKVYYTYFNVSWDGLSDKAEDDYQYVKVKSVEFKRGEVTLKRTVVGIIVKALFNYRGSFHDKDSDEFIIELKTGEKETRYFNKCTRDEHIEAIELIKTKLQPSKRK